MFSSDLSAVLQKRSQIIFVFVHHMEVFNFQDVCSSAVKHVVTSCSEASPSVDFNFGSDPEEGRCRTTSTESVLGQLKLLSSG